MKKLLVVVSLFVLTQFVAGQNGIDVKKQFTLAAQQYELLLKSHPDITKFPQSSNADGSPRDMASSWWCSGFFGGSLWYLYEYTKDPKWKDAAHKWSMAVEKEKNNTTTHDLGFMLYCPFGNGYRLTKNETYKDIMLTGAKSLATRFHPEYGVIKSWEKFANYDYPVIIDNMMNLEFLFWAAKESGNKEFYNICLSHADSTIKNHYRKDNSSYHVVCYDKGGKVLAKKTAQGYADESAWGRGQSWGLYGYVVMYRETKNPVYLKEAENIADFILNHPNLPKDKVPYWDYNAPNIPNEERDASAAAIASSALFELAEYSKKGDTYIKNAIEMLKSLSSPAYLAPIGKNNNFILMHSVGHKPQHSEVDVPLVYADYYYLEGLLRYNAWLQKKKGKKS
ncbi:glycoside hydrolase family 88 protein [Cytophagaceae bacterium YF14B1]|uniref:Glycoside hydrolase family 88 protein n=1 Tax=Xanthocytophaga flava TaxID=3048013 RepID=A0AAE3UBH8_9BACT|nr:glycoside hydrolase family 88 protein [Xanthocytophaga flavus]MDJ1483799.1 glycoside hydrolase family 88 protein [Xanthocytophaga flavus]